MNKIGGAINLMAQINWAPSETDVFPGLIAFYSSGNRAATYRPL
jgi:hypothetical protein